MKLGLHLPQYGRAAVTGAIQRVARQAEDLGFDDVWVSDHLVVPSEQPYPPPYLYDPLQSLAFAAAVTSTIGLGTSVLVLPQYASPLALANTLASLDDLAGGRVILGAGIGWSAREYEALGAGFDHRGARLEEIVAVLRASWETDPTSYEGEHYAFHDMRLLPKPAHRIPLWLGGTSDAALARAARLADGYHGLGMAPAELKPVVDRLREARPGPDFTISMRLTCPPDQPVEELVEVVVAHGEAGVDHCVLTPERGDLETWLRCAETWAEAIVSGAS
ncbi:MAG: oxidoreductase [Acidimicrobiales bacterium]|nr:oxidoreductase [Acidimicrobiales bacterium]